MTPTTEQTLITGAEQFEPSNYQQIPSDNRTDAEFLLDVAILKADYLRQLKGGR